MIAQRRVPTSPAVPPTAVTRPPTEPAPRVPTSVALASVIASLALVLTACGSSDRPAGAAAPVKGAAVSGQPGGGSNGSAGSSGSSGSPTPTAAPAADARRPASDSPAAASDIVAAYFAEINSASRTGQIADVASVALPGCQGCALDVGVTLGFQQRGLRADTDPYEITGLTAQPREGVVITVTFTATVRTVGLLDQAGRRADSAPGVPARAGTAQLALTGSGWLIQTIRYARR